MAETNQNLNLITSLSNTRADFGVVDPINAWAGATKEVFVTARLDSQGVLVQEGWNAATPETVMRRTRNPNGTFTAWVQDTGGVAPAPDDDGGGFVSNTGTFDDIAALAALAPPWQKLNVATVASTPLGQSVAIQSGTDIAASASINHACEIALSLQRSSPTGSIIFGRQINSGTITEVGRYSITANGVLPATMRFMLQAAVADVIKFYVATTVASPTIALTGGTFRLIRVKGV